MKRQEPTEVQTKPSATTHKPVCISSPSRCLPHQIRPDAYCLRGPPIIDQELTDEEVAEVNESPEPSSEDRQAKRECATWKYWVDSHRPLIETCKAFMPGKETCEALKEGNVEKTNSAVEAIKNLNIDSRGNIKDAEKELVQAAEVIFTQLLLVLEDNTISREDCKIVDEFTCECFEPGFNICPLLSSFDQEVNPSTNEPSITTMAVIRAPSSSYHNPPSSQAYARLENML